MEGEKKKTGRKKSADKIMSDYAKLSKKTQLTNFTKQTIRVVLDNYASTGQFWDDMQTLSAPQRVAMVEKFFQYISPKMQSTTVDVAVQTDKNIANKLKELSQE